MNKIITVLAIKLALTLVVSALVFFNILRNTFGPVFALAFGVTVVNYIVGDVKLVNKSVVKAIIGNGILAGIVALFFDLAMPTFITTLGICIETDKTSQLNKKPLAKTIS